MQAKELLYHTGQGELVGLGESIPVEYTLIILERINDGKNSNPNGGFIAGGEFSIKGPDVMIPHGSEVSMRFENELEVKIKALYLDSLNRREFELLDDYVESCLKAF